MFRKEIMEKSPFVWNQVCDSLLGLASLIKVYSSLLIVAEIKAFLEEFAFLGGVSVPSSLLSGNCLLILLHFRPELASSTLESKLDDLKGNVCTGFNVFLKENQIVDNPTNLEIFLKRQLSTLLTHQISTNWKYFLSLDKDKN